MTFTQRIPAELLSDLDVHAGNTLHVIELNGSALVVQVTRAVDLPPQRG